MTRGDNGKMKFTLLEAAVVASCCFENKNFASLFCKSLCADWVPCPIYVGGAKLQLITQPDFREEVMNTSSDLYRCGWNTEAYFSLEVLFTKGRTDNK